ncbi:hypothetical protein NA57DRAFT_58600 [Rhizodiscina lignyota]|uniref:Uncharacterized protein n=1 Tax=Rhizodiscina lignyota TaxID=1504668 RepID=A0A9P4M6V1_9PEZI|nr:hypothetical protein NA57DRAFT_58600 [Rhizodiscina lignyota]
MVRHPPAVTVPIRRFLDTRHQYSNFETPGLELPQPPSTHSEPTFAPKPAELLCFDNTVLASATEPQLSSTMARPSLTTFARKSKATKDTLGPKIDDSQPIAESLPVTFPDCIACGEELTDVPPCACEACGAYN